MSRIRLLLLLLLAAPAGGQTPSLPAGALRPGALPDDPFFERQVSFRNPGGEIAFDVSSRRPSRRSFTCVEGIDLNVLPAWRITTGSRKVIVAILDDGFPYGHEDVRENVWRNPGESGPDARGYPKETNGRDDDGNGYVDDVMGWDWAFDDPDPDPYIFDGMRNDRIQPYWHAISAMGIIGARGNNGIGVAGINWRVSMMLLKLTAQGTWPPEVQSRAIKAAKAIRYAADNGARVINWSGFVSNAPKAQVAELHAAIQYAASRDVLLVAAAGNSGKDIDDDRNALIPQCLDLENILNVAEIDLAGKLDAGSGRHRISASCWGRRRVGLAALARNFTTDDHNGRAIYRLGGGTSCAAPVVTGVAALMLAVNPDLGFRDLKRLLLSTARRLPALEGKVTCGGMVDAGAAVRAALAARK